MVTSIITYKIGLGSQPLLLIFMKKPLQDVTGCHGLGSLNLKWLVQNIIIHLRNIPAIKWRLINGEQRGKKKREMCQFHRSRSAMNYRH